jgi:hypothetical protein
VGRLGVRSMEGVARGLAVYARHCLRVGDERTKAARVE